MKTFLPLPLIVASALAQQQPALLGDPPDGTEPIQPEIRYAFKPAEVLETTVHHQGGRDIIVQRLALDPSDPVIPVRSADIPAGTSHPEPQGEQTLTSPSFLMMLSATVYPGPFTYLRWTHNSVDGTATEYSGWSNIDFNHLTGITSFLATDGEAHSFVMGIGTEQEVAENAPDFTTNAPTFIPDQANIPAEAMVTIDSLHQLYAIEGEKLAAAHAGRVIAEAAREAELLANPPQLQDLIIRYRIAETPLTDAEGGDK